MGLDNQFLLYDSFDSLRRIGAFFYENPFYSLGSARIFIELINSRQKKNRRFGISWNTFSAFIFFTIIIDRITEVLKV